MVQVLLGLNLAGRMADESRRDVFGFDAGPVVADLNELDAAGLDGDGDLRCTGIDGVFQKLLDHRRGPLDDLARRDQLCRVLIQNMDDCHKVFPPRFVFSRSGSPSGSF